MTGKYNSGDIPEESRFTGKDAKGTPIEKHFNEKVKESTLQKLNGLAALAKELDVSQAQLALAWAVANKDCSVALMGFSRLSQVADNIGALKAL